MDPRPIAGPVSLLIAIKQEVTLIISLEMMSNFLALAIIIGVVNKIKHISKIQLPRDKGRQHGSHLTRDGKINARAVQALGACLRCVFQKEQVWRAIVSEVTFD
ncbi:hypothetical protein V8E54_012220 [Elaphomyces granulatus]|jgi:hypothetical protein